MAGCQYAGPQSHFSRFFIFFGAELTAGILILEIPVDKCGLPFVCDLWIAFNIIFYVLFVSVFVFNAAIKRKKDYGHLMLQAQ